MGFKKPFKAVPIRESKAHRLRRERAANRDWLVALSKWVALAIVCGALIGYLTTL
ncbi:hypothetical protein I5E68_04075 [Novosphingobium sp. YJ-S2-02]|uniref:Uncharacterized protein n=1 Tax=Novosphingobium aureum TaxID=2792964 RepID=A0A931HA14_9SPHN|nr:hypothetical protein [Novosphingobium aureum]MBH0112130.1 hypothetical protein [Novosphingobium aureum]